MKKYKLTIIIVISISMLILPACSNKTNEAKPTATAVKETKNVVEASGIVESTNIENIVLDMPSGLSPKILKLNVKDGQKVKKGEMLVEIDISDYNALITQKIKTIDADKAIRKDMQSSNQKNAQDMKIQGEQAELDALMAKVNKSYINNGRIVSDMDNAVVSDISYKQGDIVNSMQKLLTLEDLNSLVITAEVDEEFIKDIKEGNLVNIIPKYDPSTKISGKVSRIYNEASKQNGDTFINVEITMDKNDGKLLPNYSVDVEISKN